MLSHFEFRNTCGISRANRLFSVENIFSVLTAVPFVFGSCRIIQLRLLAERRNRGRHQDFSVKGAAREQGGGHGGERKWLLSDFQLRKTDSRCFGR